MYCIVNITQYPYVSKGLTAHNSINFPLKPSSPQNPGKSRVSGGATWRVCGVEEEVRAVSLEAWWSVSDQSNTLLKRAGCCKGLKIF